MSDTPDPPPTNDTPASDTPAPNARGEHVNNADASDDQAPVDPRFGPMQWLGTLLIVGSFGLVVAQFLGFGVINDTTVRTLLGAGILLVAGREVLQTVAEAAT